MAQESISEQQTTPVAVVVVSRRVQAARAVNLSRPASNGDAPTAASQATQAMLAAHAAQSSGFARTQANERPDTGSLRLRTISDRPVTLPARPGDDAGARRHSELVANLRRRLAQDIGEDDVERYFDGQTRIHLGEQRLEVTVASGMLAKLLDTRYGVNLRKAAALAQGHEQQPEIIFKVDRQAFVTSPAGRLPSLPSSGVPGAAHDPQPALNGPTGGPGSGPASHSGLASHSGSAGLAHRPVLAGISQRPSPLRYTFDTYQVGKSNKLAHGAAIRMATHAGYIAPIFLHGACGMGKTHLLQATVQRFLQLHPAARVRYTTAEAFTNEFVSAIKASRVDAFRKAYRRVDLLAIDDAHFFSSKEATQAELLHTLDEVGQEGARIILASDEHPRDIQKLSERLSSRFLAGVVIRIDPPDRELRERLVVHLAQCRHMTIKEPAVRLLVDRTERSIGALGGFGGSVRELEGLLNQIDAVHRLLPELAGQDGEVGVLLVRKALGLTEEPALATLGPARARRPIAGELILAETCKALEVEVHDVLDRGRHQRVVLARALVAYLCRTLTSLSFPEIAGVMGRTNHSTVITAFKRFERQMADGEMPDIQMPAAMIGLSLREMSELVAKTIARAAL